MVQKLIIQWVPELMGRFLGKLFFYLSNIDLEAHQHVDQTKETFGDTAGNGKWEGYLTERKSLLKPH